MDLVEFLLARLTEDEAAASAAIGDRFWVKRGSASRKHIWRWQPDRVIAECEAKRRIVEWGTPNGPDYVLYLLALPYADHPDYQPEWKP